MREVLGNITYQFSVRNGTYSSTLLGVPIVIIAEIYKVYCIANLRYVYTSPGTYLGGFLGVPETPKF